MMSSGNTETRQKTCRAGKPLEQIQRAEGVPQLRATGESQSELMRPQILRKREIVKFDLQLCERNEKAV